MTVFAVVLNYGGEAETRRCVASLRLQTHPVRVLVVDNASPDGSGLRLQGVAEVLPLDVNRGFAGGMNIGAESAFLVGASHVLLLNHDAVLAPDAVAQLLAASAPVTAPTIVHGLPPATEPLWYAGGHVSPWTGIAHADTRQRHDLTPRPVGFVSGCCLLVTCGAWAELGGLDAGYFLYYEDADFCLRARALGIPVLWAPAARAWHEGGAATGSQTTKAPALDYYDARNGLMLIRRHFTGLARLTALLYWAGIRLPRKLCRILLAAPDRQASLRAALAGARDGLQGRQGPRP